MTVQIEIPAGLLERATRVFGSRQKSRRWLTRPHASLDDRRPVEAARTEAGLVRVNELLGRIEHGVYG